MGRKKRVLLENQVTKNMRETVDEYGWKQVKHDANQQITVSGAFVCNVVNHSCAGR